MIRNTAGHICVWRGGLLRATLRRALPHTRRNFATGSAAGERFQLSQSFVETFAAKTPPFGFNGLGELVYRRTYARDLDNGQMEEWYQTVERVVNGTFNMQKEHMLQNGLDYNHSKTQKLAERMYELIFDMKFLPPGRGLWAMGSPITEERKLYAALKQLCVCKYKRSAPRPNITIHLFNGRKYVGCWSRIRYQCSWASKGIPTWLQDVQTWTSMMNMM